MRARRMRPEVLRNLALRLRIETKTQANTDISEGGPEGGLVYKMATYTNINTYVYVVRCMYVCLYGATCYIKCLHVHSCCMW